MVPMEVILNRVLSRVTGLKEKPLRFRVWFDLVKETIEAVEDLSQQWVELESEEKKKLAQDTVEWIYRKVGLDVPKVPQWLEIWLLRTLTGVLVDGLVSLYNEKGWFTKTPKAA
mgnify:CR=1 FL=1